MPGLPGQLPVELGQAGLHRLPHQHHRRPVLLRSARTLGRKLTGLSLVNLKALSGKNSYYIYSDSVHWQPWLWAMMTLPPRTVAEVVNRRGLVGQ